MEDKPIPVIVIDDTPVKRRGICEFVEETPQLELFAQAGDADSVIQLVEDLYLEKIQTTSALEGYLVLSDLRLGTANGIELGRTLLRIAPGLRVVIYTQDPSWTLAAEIFRQEYSGVGSRKSDGKRVKGQPGLHGYALFSNIQPSYLANVAQKVIRDRETFIDPEVMTFLLKKLQGQRLTPRQAECAALISQGLSNDEIALHMGYLNAKGKPNIGPLENLVSELYSFFGIEGAPSDPGRRVLLAHAYEAYAGQRPG